MLHCYNLHDVAGTEVMACERPTSAISWARRRGSAFRQKQHRFRVEHALDEEIEQVSPLARAGFQRSPLLSRYTRLGFV
jgi:hypothetical protein